MPQLGLGLGLHRANRALFRGLLDQYGGAAAAYSLRALSSGWLAGDVVEVRRSEDSVQVKVGLVGGIVTLDSKVTNVTETPDQGETLASNLGEFVAASGYANPDSLAGANDGFVSTWYDQSGNANNATQPTTTAQPKIVSAGALVVGGLDFDGVDDELGADGLSADFQSKSYAAIFAVAKYDSTASATEPVFFAQAGAATGSARVFVGKVGTNFVSAGRRLDTGSFVQSTFASSTSSVLLTSMDQWADGDTQLVVNGSEKTAANYSSGAGVTSNTTSDVVSIGSLASNFMGGAINELIIYNSDQSANRAAIETNINAAYSIY